MSALGKEATFHRPPREYPAPVPTERLTIAPPPVEPPPIHQGLLSTLFPVVGGIGMVGFAIVFGSSAFLFIAGGMILLLLLFSIGMRYSQKRQRRKKAADEARRYGQHLREQDRELTRSGDLQRAALARLYPDPGPLWTSVLKQQGVWERRPAHPDFLKVRLGRGEIPLEREVEFDLGRNPLTEYQPRPLQEARRLVEKRATLRNEAVVVDLAQTGVVALTGPRERTRGWARWAMMQLAAHRAPHDVRLITCFDPADAGDWEWGKWLPHQRVERTGAEGGGYLPALSLARSAVELEPLLEAEVGPRQEQLRRAAEANPSGQEPRLEAPELIVVVDGYSPRHEAESVPAFRELRAEARRLRALVLLMVDERELEPSDVDARLRVPARGTATWEPSGPDVEPVRDVFLDEVDVGRAEALARALTPLRIEEDGADERGLGADVRLLDLLDAVPSRTRARSGQLRAPIGVRADGQPLVLDLKQAAEGGHGPHGILVGATGSGKSELLRSLVGGLAATHPPELLSFVLVDFKGGAAFVELARLPHVAGLITNLQSDLALVDRMRSALEGEIERRQRALRDAGNLDDVATYRSRRESNPDLPPLPDLLVVVDEFSELLAAKPEFIELFVSIGRVGRSLGIHLLLSSQRLDEGRLRGLDSNLRYRICLRTYSTTDSKVVLGTPDAYLLPSLPGLGYLKVDTEVYDRFRAALASSPWMEPTAAAAVAAPPEVVAFDAAAPRPVVDAAPADPRESTRTDLDVLVDRLREGTDPDAPEVHQVWLPPLPTALGLDEVEDVAPWWEREGTAALAAPVGLLDRPTEQRIDPLVLALDGGGGHVAVVGSPRTGKSTVLRTFAAALVRRHTPDEARFYAVDLGGGGLGALARAPHCGGVTRKLDVEAVHRLVRQLRAEADAREDAFREARIESMAEARSRAAGAPAYPDIFLLIDGWAAFKAEYEDLHREVEELAANGLAFGIHVVVAANRWADIHQRLLDNLGTRLELELNDPVDSIVSRAASSALPGEIPGRGLRASDELQFQAALPRADGVASVDGLGAAVEAIAAEAAARWDGEPAEPIRLLPLRLDPTELPTPVGSVVPIGLEERELSPVALDLSGADPHVMVFGDAETGKTSLLRLLALGMSGTAAGGELEIVICDIRRGLEDLRDRPGVIAHASTPDAIAEALTEVGSRVRERMRSGEPGPRTLVLFDDYDLVASPGQSPLAPVLDLVAVGRDARFNAVLARKVGGAANAAYEPGWQRVRELGSPAFVFSGDRGEGQLAHGVRATSLPPGRALHAVRGRPPVPVQIAFAPVSDSETVAASAPTTAAQTRILS